MSFQLSSFLLGLAAAWLLPGITRVLRPLAVEATATGMGMIEEARRVIAEQMEAMEDIAAEARARREDTNGAGAEESADDETTAGRSRRRVVAAGRRRAD